MSRRSVAYLILGTVAAATILAGSALTRADATDGAQPSNSCATTTPCLEEDNTSTGPGVKGTSTKGHGIVGTTKSKGTTPGNSHAGVLGQDLQTGGGQGNAGVEGTSTQGQGVEGTGRIGVLGSGVFAVEGLSTATAGVGVFGNANGSGSAGIEGVGNSIGIEGSGLNDNVFANGIGGNLFRGNNRQAADVFVVADSGDTYVGGTLQVVGQISSNGEVTGLDGFFGNTTSINIGVSGLGAAEGVMGENSPTGDAFYANGFGGNLFRGNNSHGADVFVVDDGGDVFAKGYFSSAQPRTLQRTSEGKTVQTFSSQSTQATLEDVGEAQLVAGIAHVALDPGFASTIDQQSNYIVMVTPEGMTHGTLCVTQRTPGGFVVQENMGGHSTVPFAYRLLAKPLGSNSQRLPLATVPSGFDRVHGTKHFAIPHRVPPPVRRTKIVPHI